MHLDYNHLSSISESIAQLPHLKDLSLFENYTLTALPSAMFPIPNLQQLNLGECSISELPDTIGECQQLKVLMLPMTKISGLP